MAAESQVAQRVALIAGSTGVTGAALLQLLLRNHEFSRIHAVTRRPLPLAHPRLANRILKFDELAARLAGVRCTDAFCCLGAAQGPRAPEAELRQVDVNLVVAFARTAQTAGATRMVVVSAARADRNAPQAFQRCKGEMEAALRELRFQSLEILQPGPVLGMRPQGTARDAIRMAFLPLLNPLLRGSMGGSRAILGTDLAAAMLGVARTQRRGVYCVGGESLRDLAVAGRRPS
ncbi:MAG: NAD(P)H-binding protein [Steroidobacteraceae bacterium]